MALDEQVLGQFLGDDSFPITWASETEKKLFWVFDDLHCPHPLSPMFEEIGGWWLSSHDATAGQFFMLAASSMVLIGTLSTASVVLTRWGPKQSVAVKVRPALS